LLNGNDEQYQGNAGKDRRQARVNDRKDKQDAFYWGHHDKFPVALTF